MRRCKWAAVLLALLGLQSLSAQVKYEREYRIRKEQFPEAALEVLGSSLDDVRRLRFYREVDSNRRSFEMKFKKDRLHYSVEFTPEGVLEDVEVLIKPVDIPEESWSRIGAVLSDRFTRHKVRRIQQQYPRAAFDSDELTLRNAFQNLLLPELNYEIVVQGRTERGLMQYEALFDSDGKLLNIRKALPANYDHILY